MDVVDRVGLMGKGGSGQPTQRIRIAACGVLKAATPEHGAEEVECGSVSASDSDAEEEAEVRKMLEVQAVKPLGM